MSKNKTDVLPGNYKFLFQCDEDQARLIMNRIRNTPAPRNKVSRLKVDLQYNQAAEPDSDTTTPSTPIHRLLT